MGELLPSTAAREIREGLYDYLETTFSLSDQDARAALSDFLQGEAGGLFKGPYIRTRLPFLPAPAGWRDSLDWHPLDDDESAFAPYEHQAHAFARLSTAHQEEPLPTLVTTGTGSGKTEAFLYPILDHVLRANRRGVSGMKALILYPMNALANDQAQRLADLISGLDSLKGVTAGVYIGQAGPARTVVSSDGLITSREVMRSSPPDILLTNYKMLDQLLLRHEDAAIWEKSAHSLQYLVLDEFHSYDGAQGTDVAMLLRRLGMTLKEHGSQGEKPLGKITPVATSATLGSGEDPDKMLTFAKTVFGEEFPPEAVITESRVPLEDWFAGEELPPNVVPIEGSELAERLAYVDGNAEAARIAEAALDAMYEGDRTGSVATDLVRCHPLTRLIAEMSVNAEPVVSLAERAFPKTDRSNAIRALETFAGLLSHVRYEEGRGQLSVELHLWVRELRRIDREAATTAAFSWSDDGKDLDTAELAELGTDVRPGFPAIFCRSCGRSGWMIQLSPANDTDLATSDEAIRATHTNRQGRTRPLLLALNEGELALGEDPPEEPNLRWFYVNYRQIRKQAPSGEEASDGTVIPVITCTGDDAEKQALSENCPSCGQRDSIRFLGSAVATQLSVALTSLFGSTTLDNSEKKTLVFTDSVQDAAHRAGFIQARSHSLTVRSFLREAVGDVPRSLDELAQRVIDSAGDDQVARYRILPTDLADRDEFRKFWEAMTLAKVPVEVKKRVAKRIAFDATLEFGLQSRLGRTLGTTGTVAAEVQAAPGLLAAAARSALSEAGGQLQIETPSDERLIGWARGTLEQIRERGGIEHPWLKKLIEKDGERYYIWRGRPRSEGMPAFPTGRMAPAFPRSGSKSQVKDGLLDAVASTTGWYTQWTARCIKGLQPAEAATLARLLVSELAKQGILTATTNEASAEVYSIPSASVTVAPIAAQDLLDSRHILECNQCQGRITASKTAVAQLDGMPCTSARCSGVLEPRAGDPENFYRKYYDSLEVQRVIAREHTSLLDDKTRVSYENGFKGRDRTPDAPNVLVATPTLEMGIDIGDLTTVMLASLPKSVASYVQRVGRAGRLTGSSMNLAFVPGRPDNLPILSSPLELINGTVRPPATYLGAEEILRRQFLASLADAEARDPEGCHPASPTEALGSAGEGSYLGSLVSRGESDDAHLDRFLAAFDGVAELETQSLTTWVKATDGPGTSPLARRLVEESQRWGKEVEALNFRIKTIEESLPGLEETAGLPAATDDDKLAYRSAVAAHKLALRQRKELKGEYWISALESAGLFPNYTLFDDSVTLDVSLSRLDPDTGLYESSSERFQRGATRALREFAPGATFYAGGLEIKIDAVDLGKDAESVRTYAFCSECGHNEEVIDDKGPEACPRCASEVVADVGQRLDVVELDRVSSMMRRDEASIDDARDDRTQKPFVTTLVADFEPSDVIREWYVKDYGFGIKHIKKADLCWLNLGESKVGGSPIEIAGRSFSPRLFRVCRECGQLDRRTAGNAPTEHRPWCSLRKAAKEDTVSIALSHRMETEALMIRLAPWTGVGSDFEVPSLAASVKLGLTEHLGGAPDHLEVAISSDPSHIPDEPASQVLLLHDQVPGGTGYLAELADPDQLRSILLRAYEIVRDCECAEEGKLACHKCLLPHAGMGTYASVSRATAEKLLRTVLLYGEDGEEPLAGSSWTTVDEPLSTFDPESALEKKFRAVMSDRLKKLGATITVSPTAAGDEWSIQCTGRSWKLEPQVLIGSCKPDFVLRCSDPEVPPIAIFCDGWRFHASPGNNRLAEDAEKRQGLRELGYQVIALTWDDLENDGYQASRPWLTESGTQAVLGSTGLGVSAKQVDLMRRGPLELLLGWIENPDLDASKKLARAISFVLASPAQHVGALRDGQSVADAAVCCLDGNDGLDDGKTAWAWRSEAFAAACSRVTDVDHSTDIALVLDDTVDLGSDEARQAWRHWLELSNLVGFRDVATITVRSQVDGQVTETSEVEEASPNEDLDPAWGAAIAFATENERVVLELLAQDGIPAPGETGEVQGIPLATSWPDLMITINVDLNDQEISTIQEAGWRVVDCDVDAVKAELKGARN